MPDIDDSATPQTDQASKFVSEGSDARSAQPSKRASRISQSIGSAEQHAMAEDGAEIDDVHPASATARPSPRRPEQAAAPVADMGG
ncbi:hypothetical protein NL455_28215, partial [Klebsiella pneumoniae]|nr:hypothetical protein [Klebsiella pneumoniae]